MARSGRLYGCPVELSLDLIGGKWKAVILARLKQAPMRYSDLRRAIPGLADKVLSQRLRDLEEAGMVARAAGSGGAQLYALTPRGAALGPALQALYDAGQALAAEVGARFPPPEGSGQSQGANQAVR